MKKLFCILLALLLCSCGKTEPETSKTSSVEQTEIRLVCQESTEKIEHLTKAFEKENPEIKITVIKTDENDDFALAVKSLLAGERSPDLILTDAEYLNELSDRFFDISNEIWINTALPNTLNEVYRAGEIIALPAEIEGIGFVYDKRVFESAKINPENINSTDRLTDTVGYLSDKIFELKKEFQNLEAVFETLDEQTTKFLVNAAISQECSSSKEVSTELEFSFSKAFQILFELVENNSALEKNSTTVLALKSHKSVTETENFDMLPISVFGASQDSIILNVPTFWAVSKTATNREQQATLKFLEWVYTSKTGKTILSQKLNWLSPFETDMQNANTPIEKTVLNYAVSGKTMPYVLCTIEQEIYNEILSRLTSFSESLRS